MNRHIKRNIILFGICSIIVGCIIVPFVINFIFEIKADGLLIAKWKAEHALAYSSGVLSFIGMIVLGYISYEQAKGANMMAELAAKSANEANEISLVSRIIDYETNNLEKIRIAYKDFYNTYLLQNVMKSVLDIMRVDGTIDFEKIYSLIDYRNKLIGDFNNLGCALSIDTELKQDDKNDMKMLFVSLYRLALEYIDFYSDFQSNDHPKIFEEKKLKTYEKMFEDFMQLISNYISNREEKIKLILYRKMTLKEIRNIYSIEE